MTSNRWHRKKLPYALAVLATLAVMAMAVGPVSADPHSVLRSGQLSGDYCLRSAAFEGNVFGDPTCRNISYWLPKSYWKRKHGHGGPYLVKKYPVVVMLSGNNMYRNERTTNDIVAQRCQPFDGSPTQLSAANQATYCNADTKFDQDGIAYQLQESGQTPEFILIELNGLVRYGGNRYDCSVIDGDMRTFLLRDIPKFIEKHFRVYRYDADNPALRANRKYWNAMGFSMGAGGVLGWKMEDREDRWGQVAPISPSNNNLEAMAATTPPEPSLLNLYRTLTPQIPQTNVAVNRPGTPAEIAESWGNKPLDGKFLGGSVLALPRIVDPDPSGTIKAIDGITPLYGTNPLTGPNVGDYDAALWELIKPKGLKQMTVRAWDNLIGTVIVVAHGNNKDALDVPGNPPGPANVVFQSEPGDQSTFINELRTRGVLDTEIITPGDHFTSLKHTFPAALKEIFRLAGTKTGRPSFNTVIEDEHAFCASQFPQYPSCND